MPKRKTLPPGVWDEGVFLTQVDGHKEFLEGGIGERPQKGLTQIMHELRWRISKPLTGCPKSLDGK